jgi:hypothetical protein
MSDDVVTCSQTTYVSLLCGANCDGQKRETLWGSVTRGDIELLIGSLVPKTADVETTTSRTLAGS